MHDKPTVKSSTQCHLTHQKHENDNGKLHQPTSTKTFHSYDAVNHMIQHLNDSS